jgi:hypothetical protein
VGVRIAELTRHCLGDTNLRRAAGPPQRFPTPARDILAMATGSIRFVSSCARRRRSALAGVAAVLAWCVGQSAALAQTPYVPDEWKYGKRQDGAALNYCVDERDPDLPVAKEIGRAIAQALLLQPKEHAIGAAR